MRYEIAKVVKARTINGWTQAMLARRAGTSVSTISKIENQETNPLPSTMKAIADALGLDMEDLIVDDKPARAGPRREVRTN
jgi:transcriptional regulator with XRE-family HTH domain